MSGIFGIFQISGSGLSAQRKKLNAVAQNIANVETTRTPEGGPYRRKHVVFSEDPANRQQTYRKLKSVIVSENGYSGSAVSGDTDRAGIV